MGHMEGRSLQGYFVFLFLNNLNGSHYSIFIHAYNALQLYLPHHPFLYPSPRGPPFTFMSLGLFWFGFLGPDSL
jgi:hypothetical protein